MTTPLSAGVMIKVREILHAAEMSGEILDVYRSAVTIKEALPGEAVTIDQLVTVMLERHGGIRALELTPPTLLIDILLPGESAERAPADPSSGGSALLG